MPEESKLLWVPNEILQGLRKATFRIVAFLLYKYVFNYFFLTKFQSDSNGYHQWVVQVANIAPQ